MAAKEKYAEPTYLECGFGELEHKVITPEICCRCGTCEAICPRIEHKENRPELKEYDPLCGLCFAYCPRTSLDLPALEKKLFGRSRTEGEVLGIYRKVTSAQAKPTINKAQDGGIASALLAHALKAGIIDCAIVTDRDENWVTVPRVVTTAEEIAAAAGTKYTISNSVIALKDALEKGYEKIGFVGTPCQIQALRKVQLLEEPYEFGQEKIALLIGLFCMENFDYDSLMNGVVRGLFGLEPKDVRKFEIKKGMFRVISNDGKVHEVKLEETDKFTFKGCEPCFDLVSELADISVGSVGSAEGWSTVMPRTDVGEQLYNSALAAGIIQEKAVAEKGLALIKRLAEGKSKRFMELAKEMAESGTKLDIKR
ncbi:MAG: Coenzyme F420 hydrogenase/dehydrogenase, beta subunit C-terminal domain [Methanotrichaceae archaeon]